MKLVAKFAMTADFGAVSIPMTLSRSDKIDKDIWKKYPRQIFSALALMAAIADGALAQQIVGSCDVSSRNTPVISNPPSPFDAGNSITIGEVAQGTLTISNGGNEFLGSENPIGGNKTSFIAAEFDSAGTLIVTDPGFTFSTDRFVQFTRSQERLTADSIDRRL